MLQNSLNLLANCKEAKLIYQNKIFNTKQLTERTLQIISQLSKMLLQPESRIVFCLPNSPELFCWHLACFHRGIAIVPIIYEHDPEFIQQVLQLTKPAYFITTSEKERELSTVKFPEGCKIQLNNDNYQAIISIRNSTSMIQPSNIKDGALAMIIFSTDNNGMVKGIEHTYASAFGFLQMQIEILAINAGLIYLIAQPLGHISGIMTTLVTLLNEGTAILLEFFELHFYMDAMNQYQPTHLNLHTPLFYEILDYPKINKKAFARLTTCFAGGDAIPPELPEKFFSATGAKMQIGYGAPETGIVMVNRDPYGKKANSIGKKISLVEIELRDAKNKPVKAGENGELWIKSAGGCKGYWYDGALNREAFKNGWFRTYDILKEDPQGYFWYVGRNQPIERHNDFAFEETDEKN